MPVESQSLPLVDRPSSSLPRALWIGGSLLGLVTAALAGALVMRSVDSAPAPQAATAPVSNLVGQPVPLTPATPVQTAAATAPAQPTPRATPAPSSSTARAVTCATCGVVESVSTVQEKGQGTGLGAVAGGVLGGVAGHQVGGGKGKTAMTVLGAIGGGLAGNEVEKRVRSTTKYNVHVRMEDGSTRVFKRAQAMAVGTRVVADGAELRIATRTGQKG